ncbi:MAG: ATP-dependent Clp protease ATP-binding subunit, partial [Lachnospiraceae bacterium]|nr:ATP-dependent Clp protease ATP-binding subunit [Lachnospiraceae bacterium]
IIEGEVPDTIAGKRLLSLDLSGMVAGSKYRGEFEERIKNVINEIIEAGDVLLFIDEMHTLIGAGGAEGSLDAANILKPAMARGELQIIGATTLAEYRKYVEKDAALERRFQPITIEEPTRDETLAILKGICDKYEEHHGINISEEALEACVDLSERYISDRFLPDKAIDLMDEAASRMRLVTVKAPEHIYQLEQKIDDLVEKIEDALSEGRLDDAVELKKESDALKARIKRIEKRKSGVSKRKKQSLMPDDVADVVYMWTKIPVSKLMESESNRLKNLEKTIHKRVIGQDEAVKAVSRAVRRGRVGLKEPNRPIGSFLFLGPTGVGKTEISKALAEAMFGNEENLVRVDMTEYMEKHSVSKMIGSPPGYVGYDEGGQLAEKVRRNPYSVILFDEIEKAHPDVFNILLQVLDDGHITDAQGRKVDFKNTIIIMTSNAGAKEIMEPKMLGFSRENNEQHDYEYMKKRVMDELKNVFKPEFLNRIDETIVFRALNKEDMKQIVTILLKSLISRAKSQMNLTLTVQGSVKAYIVDKAYDPKFGARPLRRKIQTDLEDLLTEEILEGKIAAGDQIEAVVKKDKIVFKPKDEKHKKQQKTKKPA